MTIDELSHQIERRLAEVREQADRLQAALDALGSESGDAPPVAAVTPSRKPHPHASWRQRRAPRDATRHAVLEALASGDAMTASQLATATGLQRERIAPELSKLAKTGKLVKASRGYKTPESEASTPASSATSTATPTANAGKSPAVIALGRELDAALRSRT
jgi:hypothetical protein